MSQMPPEPLPDVSTAGQQQIVPAHHRPPNVLYDVYGRPHHAVLGQPSPVPIIVQAPVQQGMDPALQRLIIVTFLIIAVLVTATGCVCAVVVLMGGTLMGIIGAVGQNLSTLAIALIGVIVAAGWATNKINAKAGKKTSPK